MVFANNFVCVVKCDGKVLREREDHTVYLPFKSEYSMLLKNLDSRRAVVEISIDGEDVLNGRQLIIGPTSELELERFLRDDLSKGPRFRFIQKTEEIANHRGDRVDDGIIRVEYRFEKPYEPPKLDWNWHSQIGWSDGPYYTPPSFLNDFQSWNQASDPGPNWQSKTSRRITANGGIGMGGGTISASFCAGSVPAAGEGITVPGSQSQQSFQAGWVSQLEPHSQVITLRLRGFTASKPVSKPLYVKCKISCPTCGRTSESSAQFCHNCGTALL